MTYEESLDYYRSFEKFGVEPGLERIKVLCEYLGNPQNNFKAVHITGTNGKGTTCTEIANILKHSGLKTGLYTSPEVIDFRERMQINGKMISESSLCDITDKIKSAVDAVNKISVFPTQFEILTAAAFLWFSEQKCQFVVIETGLGGRFDATNIISSPAVCCITSVSLDHTRILGDTYEKIAFEKSGIIKRGAAVVTGAFQREDVKSVINSVAVSLNCKTKFIDFNNLFTVQKEDITGTIVLYNGREIKIPFPGLHQVQNASLAIAVCSELIDRGFCISVDDIQFGIENSFIPARTEIISQSPLVILDGSHNDASTEALANLLKKYLSGKKILAVMGMMADKDCNKSVGNLVELFSDVIAVKPSNPRAMTADDFADIVRSYNINCFSFESPNKGIDFALERLYNYDAVIVCGSLYLAADIRQYLIDKF